MSTPFAIAAVTRLLRDIVAENLRRIDFSPLVDESATVTTDAPDRVVDESGALTEPRLNLYLHQISYNPAFRNADLPTRDRQGQFVNDPLLGLNLHYLLSAYGQLELQAEILMGFAMEALHRNPTPSRERITRALGASVPDMPTLEVSELAQQIESIKITPETLSVDDASKLWTALQTHMRTTVFYQVSVVLIESRVPRRTPLPVLTRGPRVRRKIGDTFPAEPPLPEPEREEGIIGIPPIPTLVGVEYDNDQSAVRLADDAESIVLEGHFLDGADVRVRFTESRSRKTLDVAVAPAEVSPIRLRVRIPGPSADPEVPDEADPSIPENWQVGIYTVATLTTADDDGRREQLSNELPVVLAPRIVGEVGVGTVDDFPGETMFAFTVTCAPPVRKTQNASLIVGQREIHAERFEADHSPTLTFRDTGFESGTEHRVRLRVDGISSIFIDRSQEPPVFAGPPPPVVIP